MCLSKPLARWLSRFVPLWRRRDPDGLDDHLRRDVGLPNRQTRPDAPTLLDMSRPGGRRW